MVVKMQHKKKQLITKSEINKGSNGDKNKMDEKIDLTLLFFLLFFFLNYNFDSSIIILVLT